MVFTFPVIMAGIINNRPKSYLDLDITEDRITNKLYERDDGKSDEASYKTSSTRKNLE